jgi:hypothetical protein
MWHFRVEEMLRKVIHHTIQRWKISFRASCVCQGAYASVARRNAGGHALLSWKNIDSSGVSRLHKLGRVADETILRDLDTLVVPVQQVE